jgi:hypothetical protein
VPAQPDNEPVMLCLDIIVPVHATPVTDAA